jgi:hypothetical protein
METTQERFWKKVNKDGPLHPYNPTLGRCWIWMASRRNKGYGAFCYAENDTVVQGRAHRYSWHIHCGPIPEGTCVLHSCDMPACVNPMHLWLGTKAENNADMVKKGRRVKGGTHSPGNYQRGEAHHGAKLTWPQVRKIRAQREQGMSFNQLAKEHHLSVGYVFHLIQGGTWKEESQGKGAC